MSTAHHGAGDAGPSAAAGVPRERRGAWGDLVRGARMCTGKLAKWLGAETCSVVDTRWVLGRRRVDRRPVDAEQRQVCVQRGLPAPKQGVRSAVGLDPWDAGGG